MVMKNDVVHHQYRLVHRLHLVLVLSHQQMVVFVKMKHTCKHQLSVDLFSLFCLHFVWSIVIERTKTRSVTLLYCILHLSVNEKSKCHNLE